MKRAWLIVPLALAAACQSSSLTPQSPPKQGSSVLPAVAVNDVCAAHTTAADCGGDNQNGCAWVPVEACPAGASCPAGVCQTAGPCAALATQTACTADSRCAWSAVTVVAGSSSASVTPTLCPVGQDCGAGFCFARASGGNGCTCLQPLACPADGSCPPVQCACVPPPPADGGGSGGGGTCSCSCPACLPGEVCPPCNCNCGGAQDGGTTGCGGAAPGNGSTCTCNCPTCPAGEACPACSCACNAAATSTMTVSATSNGAGASSSGASSLPACTCPACPAGSACAPCECGGQPPDPCAAHTDGASCVADTIDGCGWTAVNLACLVAPCPTGVCSRTTSSPPADAGQGTGSGGSGCGCACSACPPGGSCAPCVCNCCPGPADLSPPTNVGGPTPVSDGVH